MCAVAETLELVGGPKDGARFPVEQVPLDYRVPMAPTMPVFAKPAPGPQDVEMLVGIYTPAHDQYNVTSRNDAGCLVYTWQGVRRG